MTLRVYTQGVEHRSEGDVQVVFLAREFEQGVSLGGKDQVEVFGVGVLLVGGYLNGLARLEPKLLHGLGVQTQDTIGSNPRHWLGSRVSRKRDRGEFHKGFDKSLDDQFFIISAALSCDA